MPAPEITKSQVLSCIPYTLFALGKAAESCGTISEVPDLPKAFSVVAKHLPLTAAVFTSLNTYLESVSEDKEDQKLRDMYPVIKEVTENCYNHVRSLQDLFESARQSVDDAQVKLTSYRSAVQANGGRMVENVMLDLLNGVALVTLEPFVAQEQTQALQEALQEVTKLPPSLDDALGAGVVMNHSGSGSQFYHGGKGHQNICSGGFQVTGDNRGATYNYTEKAEEGIRS